MKFKVGDRVVLTESSFFPVMEKGETGTVIKVFDEGVKIRWDRNAYTSLEFVEKVLKFETKLERVLK